jgi:hypothetical protein
VIPLPALAHTTAVSWARPVSGGLQIPAPLQPLYFKRSSPMTLADDGCVETVVPIAENADDAEETDEEVLQPL